MVKTNIRSVSGAGKGVKSEKVSFRAVKKVGDDAKNKMVTPKHTAAIHAAVHAAVMQRVMRNFKSRGRLARQLHSMGPGNVADGALTMTPSKARSRIADPSDELDDPGAALDNPGAFGVGLNVPAPKTPETPAGAAAAAADAAASGLGPVLPLPPPLPSLEDQCMMSIADIDDDMVKVQKLLARDAPTAVARMKKWCARVSAFDAAYGTDDAAGLDLVMRGPVAARLANWRGAVRTMSSMLRFECPYLNE